MIGYSFTGILSRVACTPPAHIAPPHLSPLRDSRKDAAAARSLVQDSQPCQGDTFLVRIRALV